MDKFLETHNLPKVNQEKTENLNKLITTNKFKAVIIIIIIINNKSLPAYKSPGPDGLTVKFYQTFKELTNTYLS